MIFLSFDVFLPINLSDNISPNLTLYLFIKLYIGLPATNFFKLLFISIGIIFPVFSIIKSTSACDFVLQKFICKSSLCNSLKTIFSFVAPWSVLLFILLKFCKITFLRPQSIKYILGFLTISTDLLVK